MKLNGTGYNTNAVRRCVVSALFAAVLCVLGPLTFPIGPVPISLATLWILLTAGLQGRRGTLCVLVYLMLGAVGLPVFSCFAGGVSVLFGPTGGYLIGYIPLAYCAGLGAESGRWGFLAGMLAGTVFLYALGTWWFSVQSGLKFLQAAGTCVVPFLPVDVLKAAVVLVVLPRISQRLKKSGFV